MCGLILVDWEEKSVTGRLTVAVPEPAKQPWVIVDPRRDPVGGLLRPHFAVPGLVVVRDAEQHVYRTAGAAAPRRRRTQVGPKPPVHTAAADLPHQASYADEKRGDGGDYKQRRGA